MPAGAIHSRRIAVTIRWTFLAGLALVLVSTLTLPASADRLSYEITDLGGAPGFSPRFGLPNGLVTGAFVSLEGPADAAVLVQSAAVLDRGSPRDIGTFGGRSSLGLAVNARGDVVGWAEDAERNQSAFLFRDGSLRGLGTLGGHFSTAVGVNDSGLIVGNSGLADGSQRAFLSNGTDLNDLGSLGGSTSIAVALNSSGQVVGHSSRQDGRTHAFLSDGFGLTDLGDLGGGTSLSRGISSDGKVVGISTTADGIFHGFLFSGGVMTDLGLLLNDPVGVNSSGQIVGRSGLLLDGGSLYHLKDLIPPDTDWTLSSILSIDDDGRILAVGPQAGVAHTYLLTPRAVPEPSTLPLLGVGVGLLAGGRALRRLA